MVERDRYLDLHMTDPCRPWTIIDYWPCNSELPCGVPNDQAIEVRSWHLGDADGYTWLSNDMWKSSKRCPSPRETKTDWSESRLRMMDINILNKWHEGGWCRWWRRDGGLLEVVGRPCSDVSSVVEKVQPVGLEGYSCCSAAWLPPFSYVGRQRKRGLLGETVKLELRATLLDYKGLLCYRGRN